MAEYLRYVIRNTEPVRIADDSTSQSGQTDSLRFIPGSTIRGAVIGAFAELEDLNKNIALKKLLFAETTVFTNAYLTTGAHTLIPSPKGFYEDKTTVDGVKELSVNVVVKGETEPGTKRASLGRYCYLDQGCIHYYSVKTGSDLKIRINGREDDKQSLFRNEYIAAGQYFEGYIRLTGTGADQTILNLFGKGKTVILGNARSSGLGKCKVVVSEKTENLPYLKEAFDASGECYVELLSDTAMRNACGEYCGLDTQKLEDLLGVSNLEILYCATSTREIKGYNRTWQTRVPSLTAYEQGSVFHLRYTGTITKEAMKKVSDTGIGVRKNEGFGRILFLKDYEEIHCKKSCAYSYTEENRKEVQLKDLRRDDAETLKVAARGYYQILLDRAMEQYVVSNPMKKGGLKKSQLGTVLSILTSYRYLPKQARQKLIEYFGHASEKENKQNIQKARASVNPLRAQILDQVLDRKLNDILFGESFSGKIMGIPVKNFFTEEEEERCKLELLIRMIRFDNKEA